jgi:hypothetical protein
MLNNRILLLSIFTFLLQVDLRGQKITYSPQDIDGYTYDFLKIAGYNDEGFYLFQSNLSFESERDRVGFKTRKFKITFYANNLSIKWSQKIESKNDDEKIETIAIMGGAPAVVKSKFVGKEDKLTVSITTIDNNGAENKKSTILGTISFSHSSSLDKIKIVPSIHNLQYAIVQNERKTDGTQTIHCLIVDNTFSLQRQFSFDVPYPEKNFSYENWILSDEGDFMMEGSYYSKENSETKRKWDAYKLFICKASGTSTKEYPLNSSLLELNGSNIAYDAVNKQVLLAAFYDEKSSGKSGILYAKLKLNGNDTLEIIKQPIQEGTLARMFNEQVSSKGGLQINNLAIEKMVLRNDGGAVLISEASYVSDYSYYDYFTQSYIRNSEYHFNNVIILSVNNDGTIDWDAVLRKEQVSTNDYGKYSSFCQMQTEGEINIIYNTQIERNNTIALFSVDKSGEANRKEINKPEDRILIIPYAARQISADELVFPCWNRKKLLMAKITF